MSGHEDAEARSGAHSGWLGPVVAFFVLTFVLSWGVWVGLYQSGVLDEPLARILGTWGPTVSAFVLVGWTRGRRGVGELAARHVRVRANPIWYLLALGGTAAIVVPAILVHRALGGVVVEANDPAQWYLVFPALVQILFLSVLGEEAGWRGYAAPPLQRRLGPLAASLIVGIVWGIWHLPLWWMGENFHGQLPFALFVLQSVGLSVLLTWVYNRTRGSLFLVALFHAASNLTIGVAPLLPQYTGGSIRPLLISVGALCVAAVAVVVGERWYRPRTFTGEHEAVH
ncbi:MAG: CPBP family intramembrane glutamic endopeptidase [Spirochaetota bacterium]